MEDGDGPSEAYSLATTTEEGCKPGNEAYPQPKVVVVVSDDGSGCVGGDSGGGSSDGVNDGGGKASHLLQSSAYCYPYKDNLLGAAERERESTPPQPRQSLLSITVSCTRTVIGK